LRPRNLALKKPETSLYSADILTDDHFILSQSTYLTDRQTDRKATAIVHSNRVRRTLTTDAVLVQVLRH